MSAILRVHGLPWAEFDVVEGPLGKTVEIVMKRDSKKVVLLTMTAVGGKLLYSTVNNKPVLGDTRILDGAAEHAEGKEKP